MPCHHKFVCSKVMLCARLKTPANILKSPYKLLAYFEPSQQPLAVMAILVRNTTSASLQTHSDTLPGQPYSIWLYSGRVTSKGAPPTLKGAICWLRNVRLDPYNNLLNRSKDKLA